MTINTTHNFFDLTKAPAGDGVAAIQAFVGTNDFLTGHSNYSSGHVVRPCRQAGPDGLGGQRRWHRRRRTDAHDTIKILH